MWRNHFWYTTRPNPEQCFTELKVSLARSCHLVSIDIIIACQVTAVGPLVYPGNINAKYTALLQVGVKKQVPSSETGVSVQKIVKTCPVRKPPAFVIALIGRTQSATAVVLADKALCVPTAGHPLLLCAPPSHVFSVSYLTVPYIILETKQKLRFLLSDVLCPSKVLLEPCQHTQRSAVTKIPYLD